MDPAYKDTGAVKAISSADYQSNLGLGPAQLAGTSGGTGSSASTIPPKAITTGGGGTSSNWMESDSSLA